MNILERQVILGVFTHRTRFLPGLLESVQKYLPDFPFLVKVTPNTIKVNMHLLWRDFCATGYRYWVFLDDDMQFLSTDTVNIAVRTLVRNAFAGVTIYSNYNPSVIETGADTSALQERELTWMPGYFMMVDRALVGDIEPDQGLPYGNVANDTIYSTAIKAKGFRLGIAPTVCYHAYKNIPHDEVGGKGTEAYIMQKWGPIHFEWFRNIGNIVGGFPATYVE